MTHQTLQRQNIHVQSWLVAIGVVLMTGKFIAFFITHSNAILTDALESIVNVIAGSVSLYGLYLTAQPRDENHPYGHGKVEYIIAGIEGGLIAAAGLLIIVTSIYRLFVPQPIQNIDLGLYITAAAGVVNFFMGYMAARRGKRIKSLPLEASGKHLMSDGWSTLGLIIGLAMILLTGWVWLDSLIALLFGIIILAAGYRILKPSIAGIMDEADYSILQQLVQVVSDHRKPDWIDIHNMRAIKYGSTLHIDCHMTQPWYYDVQKAHETIEEVERIINRELEAQVELFIHVDPCLPTSCRICTMENCTARKQPLDKPVNWTLPIVLQNRKHSIQDNT